MVFSSISFITAFLPLVTAVYLITHLLFRHTRAHTFALNVVLLIVSLKFYRLGEKKFMWVMLLVGTVDYFVALALEANLGHELRRRLLLTTSVTFNMGLLIYFKYRGFLVDTLSSVLSHLGAIPAHVSEVVLPIGISFYTFESISYIIEVYRGQTKPTRQVVNYWTFLTFFPHLVAGPIIRFSELKPQLEARTHTWEGVLTGSRRFVVGFAKKILIANSVGAYADYLFALDPAKVDALTAWLATASYTLQIYFDFSGYSDMAIGLSKFCGITLPENFDHPYTSSSVQEFWRRWHMTLSRWFRDYLYIPLGGNRAGPVREYRNLILVFAFCGLWHGASWTFLCWGLYHGVFLVLERVVRLPLGTRVPGSLRWGYAMIVVMFGWVLFRVDTLAHCGHLWRAMLGFGGESVSAASFELLSLPHFTVPFVVACVASWPAERVFGGVRVRAWRASVQYDLALGGLFLLSVAVLCGQSFNPFIYFRF